MNEDLISCNKVHFEIRQNVTFKWRQIMKFREFLDLTDEEIRFILTEIFHPARIENIQRDMEWNEFTVDMTTDGWDDGEGGEFEITDEITLKLPGTDSCGLQVDFLLNKEDSLKWKQFLLAKGCNYLLKDNPYLVAQ